MGVARFLRRVNGQIAEVLGLSVSTGASDAGKIVETSSDGRLDISLMPTGVGADTVTKVASEALSANDLVNFFDDAGTSKVRKADASNGRRANGYVKDAVASAGTATVYLGGTIVTTGMTVGPVYLGTGGAMTATPPSTSNHISQEIGNAISATEVIFEAQSPITIA